jgi:hypothetical protein
MKFTQQHSEEIQGLIHGFDRILLRGMIPNFQYVGGMKYYLSSTNTLLKDFSGISEKQTKELKEHIENLAKQNGISIEYLNNSSMEKEANAKKVFSKNPSKEGLVAVLSALEVSMSITVRSNGATKQLETRNELRNHLHYYLYYMDEEFGWMHVRLQSWYPFSMQIYVNGKEWLKRQLDKEGIKYGEHDNSLTWIGRKEGSAESLKRAQELSNQLVNKKWDRFCEAFARKINPHLALIEQVFNGNSYKWMVHQSEYATDVLFKERNYLDELFPHLVQNSILFNGAEDIYTFFGRSIKAQSTKEGTGSLRQFDPGFRVKHCLDKNSIKMYNKGSILRVETTINNSKAFKIYQETNKKGVSTKAWVPMGKSVSNLYRFAEVAQQANLKYLEKLAEVKPPSGLSKQVEDISQPVIVKSRSGNERNISGFNLLSKPTCLLLEAISNARFCLRPFKNSTLCELLIEKKVFQTTDDPFEIKKLSNKITRLIAKLKAHKLITAINKTFTYKLTKKGQTIIHNLLKFKKIDLDFT